MRRRPTSACRSTTRTSPSSRGRCSSASGRRSSLLICRVHAPHTSRKARGTRPTHQGGFSMIRKSSWILLALAGLLVAAVPVAAHHAIAAQYDMDKAGEWTGTLKKMEFVNPHSMLHLDVTGPDGKVTEWVFQTTNAGTLRTRGLARTGPGSLEPGAKYTVKRFAARNRNPMGLLGVLVFPGRTELT